MKHLRSALHAFDDATVKLSAAAKHARSRADACKGVNKLKDLYAALNADDVIAGPPNAEHWADQLSHLVMVVPNLVENDFGAKSTETPFEIAGSFDTLHEDLGKMLATAK